MGTEAPSTGSEQKAPSGGSSWGRAFREPSVMVAIIGLCGVAFTNMSEIRATIQEFRTSIPAEHQDYSEDLRNFYTEAVTNNYACINSAEFFHENPNEYMIDGTYCETGDIFFRIQSPDGERATAVVLIEDLLERTRELAQANRRTASLGALPGAAFAATPDQAAMEALRAGVEGTKLAQTIIVTVCQRLEDDGKTLIRRVSRDGQCFEERWDTSTGQYLNESPSTCDATC